MTGHDSSAGISRILFPLRTGVELFEDATSPAAPTRAKEAAVLYDELIFESGLFDTTVSDAGSTSFWIPSDDLTEERLRDTRRPVPLGSPMTFSIGKQEHQGVPAEQMEVAFSGPISARYASEFHSGILDELEQFDPDWVKVLELGGSKNPGALGDPTYEAIRQRNFSELGKKELMPDTDQFLRSFIYESFHRDSVIAASLEASLNVTPLFSPMIEEAGFRPEHPGDEALSIIVPNIGSLPWEAVVGFREHHGSEEARAQLREFERLATEQEPQDAYDFLKAVSAEVNRGFMATVKELAPNLPEELAKEALLLGVSVVSVIGGPIASVASTVSETRAFNRSWVAALMKLQAA